jgi:hypothetical protein
MGHLTMLYDYPLEIYVRERIDTLLEEAARQRQAARMSRRRGIWAAVRSALRSKTTRQHPDAADDAC